jgi:uncharacterized protein YndB with AHSA1/START domain
MSTTSSTSTTTQVYRVYIKATPEAIWQAITNPDFTEKYMYASRVDYDLRPGGAYRAYPSDAMRKGATERGFEIPDVIVDGEVIEADPPRRLVQTWRLLMDPALAAEGFTRLTWEIEDSSPGISRLTVVHDLEGAGAHGALVAGEREAEGAGGGWNEVLSGLKTLLETGAPLHSE